MIHVDLFFFRAFVGRVSGFRGIVQMYNFRTGGIAVAQDSSQSSIGAVRAMSTKAKTFKTPPVKPPPDVPPAIVRKKRAASVDPANISPLQARLPTPKKKSKCQKQGIETTPHKKSNNTSVDADVTPPRMKTTEMELLVYTPPAVHHHPRTPPRKAK